MQSLINLDQNIFGILNSFLGKSEVADLVWKILAVYTIYLVPVLFIFFWFWNKNETVQKFLLELFFGSVVSWQIIARILGEWINRPRPSTFLGAKEVLFHPPTYSFPSDHALFLAFLTTYLYFSGYKKMGNVGLIFTIFISIARIIGGFHFPADILAGWILGFILAFLFYKVKKYIQKYFAESFYRLAKLIKLI